MEKRFVIWNKIEETETPAKPQKEFKLLARTNFETCFSAV